MRHNVLRMVPVSGEICLFAYRKEVQWKNPAMAGFRNRYLTCWAASFFQPRQLLYGEVEVWRASMKQRPALIDILSTGEQVRAERLSDAQTRRRFVIARGLLRRVLSTYIGKEPKSIQISARQGGKPYLVNDTELCFNISHSADAAIIGVARGHEVGVDVELRQRLVARVDKVARRRLTSKEYENLERFSIGDIEKMRSLFLELWTRKEAFVKCTGQGIARDLKSFEMSVNPEEEPRLLSVDGSSRKASQWSIRSLHTAVEGTDVFASIVVESPSVKSLRFIDI